MINSTKTTENLLPVITAKLGLPKETRYFVDGCAGSWLYTSLPRQLVLFVAAVMSVSYQGFQYGVNNNALQVPILQVSGNPSLYVGDPFIATLHDYFSVVWGLLGALHLRIDWAPVFLALHVLSRYLTNVAFYALLCPAVLKVRDRVAGAVVLGNAAVLFAFSPIGRHTMLADYFEHTGLANAVLLLACAAWLRRRRVLGFCLLGITFDVNAFVGAWVLLRFCWLHSLMARERCRAESLAPWPQWRRLLSLRPPHWSGQV